MAAAPTVVSVSATDADTAYGLGKTLHLTITFDEAVAVTGGTPRLLLETGDTDHYATYLDGSGTTTLVFTYTVQAGDSSADLDYFSTAALMPYGAAIKSVASGLDAALTLPQMGAAGSLGANKGIVVDGIAPGEPSAPDLASASDNGDIHDNVTNDTTPTFTGGLAPAFGSVTLYDTDGTVLGTTTADGNGDWSLAVGPLADGQHVVTASAADSAGNEGPRSAATTITVDTVAPTLTITSDKDKLKAGETATIEFTFSEEVVAFTNADVTVSGGTLGPLSGSGKTYTATFTPAAGVDGAAASITVNAGAYIDKAGNVNGFAATPALYVDTVAPGRPDHPRLAEASDSGEIGDQVTELAVQVIEGEADPYATVALYDAATLVATFQAGADGKWSYTAHFGDGSHALAVAQADAAGNQSQFSIGYQLIVDLPPAPPPPPPPPPDSTPEIDGVPVIGTPTLMHGGVTGTRIEVARVEPGMGGADGIADIPLGAAGLVAHLPAGYGLAASIATAATGNVQAFLAGSLAASALPVTAYDRAHFSDAAAQFLATTPSGTVQLAALAPSSTAGTHGALVLADGGAPFAAVIDASGIAAGGSLVLEGPGYAGVLGAATVTLTGAGVLAGDSAAQDLTVHGGARLLAGGGDDILRVAAPAAATATTTTLHGGLGNDTAVFAGARADYDVEYHHGYVTVSSIAAPRAQALVLGVEQLRFADGVVQVGATADEATVAGLYENVLGRQADLAGFAFWSGQHDAGMSWGRIALGFIDSAEHAAHGGGFNGDSAHDIGLLYQSLFGRAADAGGLAFWQAAMANGLSLEQVANAFVTSAEMAGHQVAAGGWDFSL